jgi:hypothetical protein
VNGDLARRTRADLVKPATHITPAPQPVLNGATGGALVWNSNRYTSNFGQSF